MKNSKFRTRTILFFKITNNKQIKEIVEFKTYFYDAHTHLINPIFARIQISNAKLDIRFRRGVETPF